MNLFSDISDLLPDDFFKFLITILFSFLIGLEQRSKNRIESKENAFGSDRTFTLIGIIGFVLYKLDPVSLFPFLLGFALLGILLALYYKNKVESSRKRGMTTIIVALITYCLAPFIYTQPPWLVILLIVTVLILVEIKDSLFELSKKIDNDEFITLAKFLIMAGVILPILPNQSISTIIDFSPYKFWLAIVAVSAISYLSYLLKKFVFPKSGIVLTGILGGLYSSTATTFILAKKSKELNEDHQVAASIILATAMMFLRIFVFAIIFNRFIAAKIAPVFLALFLTSILISTYLLYLGRKRKIEVTVSEQEATNDLGNPLELKTALIFGVLFVFFAILTHYVTRQFGAQGIKILSYLVGVTDIDPFIINILQSKYSVSDGVLSVAIINAITSNNLLKMVYAIVLGATGIRHYVIAGFSILIILGLLAAWMV
ncbi:MAG: DUF4010 domain-containing protein [Saprospiraceae bacterium]|nr:DUF4010 domain-containing protein [Saprospiraceae bacterium]